MSFPLRQFAQGREHLKTVNPSTSLSTALTMMTRNDFSQLPVVNDAGQLCGVLSEQSIVRTQFHLGATVNVLSGPVEQCCDNAVSLDADRDIFEALAKLRDTAAVIIVEQGVPIGIVTDYDTTEFFRNLFEGLLWANDIELILREYIKCAFPAQNGLTAALMHAFGPDRRDGRKPSKDYEHLSLGEHIALIETEENWPKFQAALEPKDVFHSWMERVRVIRNNIAHVRGEADGTELDAMHRAYAWLQKRPRLPDPQPTHLEHVTDATLERIHVSHTASGVQVDLRRDTDTIDQTPGNNSYLAQGKYAPLSTWLRATDSALSRVRLAFDDIAKLLGEELPPTASLHRSWWANDTVGHVQSKAWLRAGWLVESVDFAAREVTFERSQPGGMKEAGNE